MAAVDGDRHGVRIMENPEGVSAQVLVKGAWISWQQFCNEYEWNQERERFVSKALPHTALNYIDPQLGGFVDDVGVYPIKQISSEVFAALKAHSCAFREGVQCKDVDGVLQVYTSPGDFQLPPALRKALGFLSNGKADDMPSHYGVRLIHDGKVYSIGLVSDSTPQELGRWGGLATMCSKVKIPDLDECRPFRYGRPVTSIPLSKEQVMAVFAHFTKARNRDVTPFSIANNNCAVWACKTLQVAGVVPPDLKESCGSVAFAALRALLGSWTSEICNRMKVFVDRVFQKIEIWLQQSTVGRAVLAFCSVVGKGVSLLVRGFVHVMRGIQRVARFVFSYVFSIQPIRDFGQRIWKVISYPFEIVSAVCRTFFVWLLGGALLTKRAQEASKVYPSEFAPFMNISCFSDIFRTETMFVTSSRKLLNWQKQQATTQIFDYHSKPELCLIKT
jgi:hypothetical protein